MGIEFIQRDISGHGCRDSQNNIQRELRVALYG